MGGVLHLCNNTPVHIVGGGGGGEIQLDPKKFG